jgi:F-type H+-transporting ATPase subunit epsilon
MPLKLEIVTPEKRVLEVTADHVVLPTEAAGEIDVLPMHIPLMTMIAPGALTYYQGDAAISVAVDRGFITVHGDTITVLTEAAIEVSQIDPRAAEDARARADAALQEARRSGADEEILEQLETRARFAVLQKIIGESRR